MDNDSEAQAIVDAALSVRASHPNPVLDVLDLAMEGRHRSDPNFEDSQAPEGDHTDPSAPFGRLLRDAFAPALTDALLVSRGAGHGNESAFWSRWESEVMEPFAERYALWGVDAPQR
jgi:hypothetical protein